MTSKKTTDTYFPLINSNKKLIGMKRECAGLFSDLSVDLDDLIFINEINENNLDSVILVDHNELDEKETELKFHEHIEAVLDHRTDKGLFLNASPRIVDASIGSNASIVFNLIHNQGIELDESIARMLSYPIIIDTSNMTRRTSEIERFAIDFITKKYGKSIDRETILNATRERLKIREEDYGNTYFLLSQDYKQYKSRHGQKWGISSIRINLKEWFEKNDTRKLFDEINEYMRDNELVFLGMTSSYTSSGNKFKKDILYICEPKMHEQIGDSSNASHKETGNLNEHLVYKLFSVKDTSWTRKQWQPFFESFLNK